MFPVSETEFFSKTLEREYIFIKDGKGNVTGLKVREGQEESIVKKIK
jgi:hypothetical protein